MSLQTELRAKFPDTDIKVEDTILNGEEATEIHLEKGKRVLIITIADNRRVHTSHAIKIVSSYMHRLNEDNVSV